MTILQQIRDAFTRWMNAVAVTIVAVVGRFRPQREIEVRDGEGDLLTFHVLTQVDPKIVADHSVRLSELYGIEAMPAAWHVLLRGSRARLVLKSQRFLFRPLELPRRATEFLEGIVRSQIDRITPWSVDKAVYSSTSPVETGNDRITVIVAATARDVVMPYVEVLARLDVAAVLISTMVETPNAGPVPVRVLEHTPRGGSDMHKLVRVLTVVLACAGAAAGISLSASAVITAQLETRQQELSRQIAARRNAIRAGGPSLVSDGSALARRKNETPSSVIVIEALSGLLPDHTYVTELRIEGDKLQLVGVTRDAPSLIQLIEQAPQFARATFFAPTTRSPDDPGERFHIEARLQPMFAVAP
jgi:general secretion pathway protein L